jgi:2-dehydro-3-deoxyphosphogluconate aldolase / (4S)-4-hydroxy-2-oxoglutarate aldolase
MGHNQFIASSLRLCPVIPVLAIEDPADAVPLAQALVAGGLRVLEVTLRTTRALEVIEAMARGVPEAIVIAGTVIRPAQMRSARDAGACMAVSPGLIPSLLEASHKPGSLALLAGASTASELMLGMEAGLENFKLFPAQAVGGLGLLKAWYGPFPQLNFCPTGGIDLSTAQNYLALPNVACVGGSWMVPQKALLDADWAGITALALQASQLRA